MTRARTPVFAAATAAAAAVIVALLAATSAAAATTTLQRVGRAPAIPAGATLLGALGAGTPMHVTIALQPRDAAALLRLVAAVSEPGSPDYRRYLTPVEFGERFGASPAELSAVRSSLQADGLTPGPVATDRLSLPVSATAGALSRAFSLVFSRIRVPGLGTAVINSAAPALDGAIAPDVQAIIGLNSLDALRPLDHRAPLVRALQSTSHAAAHVATGGPQPCAAATAAAPAQSAYTADQIASAYDFSGFYQAGDEGAGVTIGVYELEPDATTDIAAYQACYGTSAQVSYVPIDGGAGSGAGSGEAALDIEQVIGLAPKASVIVYQGPNSNSNGPGSGPYDTVAAIVDEDRAQVVTNSWGQCEAMEGATDAHAEEILFEQAAVQGQTFLSAAGDEGSEDCDSGAGLADSQLAVDDPGSDPFVTSVGGTSLKQLGPPPVETVWNNGGNLQGLLGLVPGAGGGGVSALWPMPSYQSSAAASLGVIGTGSSSTACGAASGYCREVPDVSADADPDDGYLIYYNGSGSVAATPVGWQGTGGTSGSAPVWAALVALADASKQCAGAPIGFLNPALYRAADTSYADLFNDVTSGNNDFTGSHGGLYPAKAGYDMATGLGTPDAAALGSALCEDSLRLVVPAHLSSSIHAAVAYSVAAKDAPGASVSYSATGLPTGLQLNPATGVITGKPGRTGTYTVQILVSDGDADTQGATFSWDIVGPPKLSAVSLGSVAAARPVLRFTVGSARGGSPFTKLAISLPSGLRFAARPHALTVTGSGGSKLRFTESVSRGTLILTFPQPSTHISVALRYAAITANPALVARVRGGARPSLKLAVKATDASTGVSSLTTTLKPAS